MSLNVMLTGATGLLGTEMLRRMPQHWDVSAVFNRQVSLPIWRERLNCISLDLTDSAHVERTCQSIRPDVIIHTASMGDLDLCEKNQKIAWQLNVEATRILLQSSRPFAPLFVFTSSMYLFDGTSPPYDETSAPNPLSYYANTKLEAERLVLTLSPHPAIFRLNTLYGWHMPHQRTNCVTWLLRKLKSEKRIQVVDDIVNNYLWVGDASDGILAAIHRNQNGLFHAGGAESMSRYAFSLRVAAAFDYDPRLISPCSSTQFHSLVPRPGNTTCSTKRLQERLGIVPLGIDAGLAQMKNAAERYCGNGVLEQEGGIARSRAAVPQGPVK